MHLLIVRASGDILPNQIKKVNSSVISFLD
jgi:hypothetical protein